MLTNWTSSESRKGDMLSFSAWTRIWFPKALLSVISKTSVRLGSGFLTVRSAKISLEDGRSVAVHGISFCRGP